MISAQLADCPVNKGPNSLDGLIQCFITISRFVIQVDELDRSADEVDLVVSPEFGSEICRDDDAVKVNFNFEPACRAPVLLCRKNGNDVLYHQDWNDIPC